MGISTALATQHIAHWQAALRHPLGYAYRTKWPAHLFRHERVENAAAILRSGQLLCRADAAAHNFVDVAPADIIAARADAQQFVRLYFRPKTPTQYHIEGIRKRADLYRDRHAPILVSFVFRAANVLCARGTQFSDGNMQSEAANTGGTDAFFQSIPFARVYHEGPFISGSIEGVSIIHARCAEVLVNSPLGLDGNLIAILCRSSAERQTLLHLAGRLDAGLVSRIRVFRELGIFNRQFAYVESVSVTGEGMSFSLHPRVDSKPVDFRTRITDKNGAVVLQSSRNGLDPSKKWVVRDAIAPGGYVATIWLEDEIAYKATADIDELPF